MNRTRMLALVAVLVAGGVVGGYLAYDQFLRGDSVAPLALPSASPAVSGPSAPPVASAPGSAVAVTAARLQVDLTTLASDDGRRDRRIRELGLESSRFPTATFKLTQPVPIPAEALTGTTVNVTLIGDLDLHGVTRSVSIPAQTRLDGDRIEVVGSLTFPFADFRMEPPNIAGFVTVEQDATLEFLVTLARG